MAVIELPKDEYSNRCRERGLDVCPVKLTGLSWLRARLSRHFGKTISLDELDAEREIPNSSTNPAKLPRRAL